MNIKMATNAQLSTTESKKKNKKQIKQTTKTETESQILRSFGRLSAGKGKGENGVKGSGIKKHNWQVQNRQGSVKNSIGNGEAKEPICTIHGHELSGGMLEEGEYYAEEDKGGKPGKTVIA